MENLFQINIRNFSVYYCFTIIKYRIISENGEKKSNKNNVNIN